MADPSKLDSPPAEGAAGDGAAVAPATPEDRRGRAEYVIAFGVVALVSMIFGFLIGLMF